jgi:competence protein ComEA
MQSLWDKLEWKEKAWLGAVYSVSLLLTFLVAYNLGRGSGGVPPPKVLEAATSRETRIAESFSLTSGAVRPQAPKPADIPTESSLNTPVQEIDLSGSDTATPITVHVAGRVQKPGVYTLPPHSRIKDALQQAGGAKAGADLDGINLAEPLSDGQKIYVPHKGEMRIASASAEPRGGGGGLRAPTKAAPRFPLDINRASAEELEALPGIGPVLAARIVEYRQLYGRFQSVDELIEVRGIGPKRLEQIRPYVVVR